MVLKLSNGVYVSFLGHTIFSNGRGQPASQSDAQQLDERQPNTDTDQDHCVAADALVQFYQAAILNICTTQQI